MAGKRKDAKGRVLRTGESTRSDGRYMYRYTDKRGKRHTIYADDLKTLRELEAGVADDDSDEPVILKELITLYLTTKNGIKRLTKETYQQRFNLIKDDSIMDVEIDSLTTIKLKKWLIDKNKIYASSTCKKFMDTLIHPALEMALQDQLIERNPANFKLADVLKKDQKTVRPLTKDEEKYLFQFIKDSNKYKKYYDLFIVAIDTGLRISELCGLTVSDFDLDTHSVHVTKQLQIYDDQSLEVVDLKSTYSERIIPLTQRAEESVKRLIEQTKPYRDIECSGYSGFIFLTRDKTLLTRRSLYRRYRHVIADCDEMYKTNLCNGTTFHSLRHTFATKLATRGMAPKNLQYLMGHSKIETTLNIYAHVDKDTAFDEFFKLTDDGDAS